MAAAHPAPGPAASPALQELWQRKSSVQWTGLLMALKKLCWMVFESRSWNVCPGCWLVLSQAGIWGDMLDMLDMLDMSDMSDMLDAWCCRLRAVSPWSVQHHGTA